MMLSQKSAMRPATPGAAGGEPFGPHRLRAGVLVERDRPEYGAVYRARADRLTAGEKR
jgi:2-oxoglutarate ferredoxin oxidoreductase subunit beta